MKKAKEFMDEFMHTLRNMAKYQDVKLNPVQPNYDEFERAFTEEKKIVETCTEDCEISETTDKNIGKKITWKDEIRVDGLPLLTMEEVDLEMQNSNQQNDFQR